MQNFSDILQGEHFSNWGLNEGVEKNARFSTRHCDKIVRDRA